MTRTAETGRAAAHATAAAFGCKPETIYKYADVDESHNHVDNLSCKDRPSPGLVSYSTLGVHLVPNLLDEEDLRVELAGIVRPHAFEPLPATRDGEIVEKLSAEPRTFIVGGCSRSQNASSGTSFARKETFAG